MTDPSPSRGELRQVLRDLTEQCQEIDRMVASLDDEQWALPTPAPGWSVFDQVAHLTFVFRLAATSVSRPEVFAGVIEATGGRISEAVTAALEEYRGQPPGKLLIDWQAQYAGTVEALAGADPEQVVPWLVNPLPPAVLGRAGIMEAFAHGQDIADALDLPPRPSDRLRQIVEFAVLTRDFGYQARDLTPPTTPFHFQISGPAGELWEYGPRESPQRVVGPALDLCLLVTRRRHRSDLSVSAVGAEAEAWLDLAQAYRGPSGPGRRPGQFSAARGA